MGPAFTAPDSTLYESIANRADRTVSTITSELQKNETASLPQVIEIVQNISSRADEISVQHLADILSRDLTTVAKVLGVAKTLGYNPDGVPITTITQAIHVVGFEKIRNLAITLLLAESATNRDSATEPRDVAAMALTSGTAAELMIELRQTSDPEAAFVCAALRHYGDLLLSTFMLEDYRAAIELSTKRHNPESAFEHIFGLTPLELGRRVLKGAGLPAQIVQNLAMVEPGSISRSRMTPEDDIRLISWFSAELSAAIAGNVPSLAAFKSNILKISGRFGKILALREEDIDTILQTVHSRIEKFTNAHRVKALDCRAMNNLRAMANGRDPGTTGSSGSLTPERQREVFAEAIQNIASAPADRKRDRKAMLTLAANTIKQGLNLDEWIFFIKDGQIPVFSARLGEGGLYEAIQAQPVLSTEVRDIFSVCLLRGEDVFIKDTADPKIAVYLPRWLKTAAPHATLVLLPVRDDDGTFAIFCGVRNKTNAVDFNSSVIQQTRQLRSRLAHLR